MKFRVKSLLTACVSAQLLLGTVAFADPCTFTPDTKSPQGNGTFVGQVAVKSIGTVALPQGLAVFDGHTIDIEAVPEWLFDRDEVLTGAVINSSITSSGPNAIIKGLVFFTGGHWIKNLGSLLTRDTITTVSGSTIAGSVQTALPDGLEVLTLTGNRMKVAFTDIQNIVSPRAFRFAATAESLKLDPASTAIQAEPMQIAFVPIVGAGTVVANSKARVPQSHLPGTEGGIPNSVLASEVLIDVAVNVIAPAVAIPLCFGVNRNSRTINKLRADQAQGGTYGPIYP